MAYVQATAACSAHIACDGCGVVASPGPVSRGGRLTQWFLDGKPVPNWSVTHDLRAPRKDFCPSCVRKRKS